MSQIYPHSLAPAYIDRRTHTPHRFVGRPQESRAEWLYMNMNTEETAIREGVGTYDYPIAYGPETIISNDVNVEFVKPNTDDLDQLYNSVEISKVTKVQRHYQYNPGEVRGKEEQVYHLTVVIRCIEGSVGSTVGNILDLLAWNFFITNSAGYIAMSPFNPTLSIRRKNHLQNQHEALYELIETTSKKLNLPVVSKARYMETWSK